MVNLLPPVVATPTEPYRYRWQVLVVVLVADVMDLLDATVTQVAAPSVLADLGGGATTMQWVLAGYTLAFGVGLLISARAGDRFGRRRMFLAGIVGFTLASLLCGLAPTSESLIVFRIVQGLFGAVMIPQGLAMVKQSFPREELQKAFIPFAPVMGLAAALGPVVAGAIIGADVFGSGWRMIFLVNVPVGVVGTYLAWRCLPSTPGDINARLDPVGTALLAAASAALIFPLVQGRELGWPSWCLGLLAASALSFALFLRAERRSGHPVIEPSLFSHRGFVAGLLFLGTYVVATSGVMLVVNLYLQLGLGFTPLATGITLTPLAAGIAVGAAASGALLGPRFGRRVVHAGLVLTAVGLGWLAFTLDSAAGLTDVPVVTGWDLAPGLLLAGLGSGAVFSPLFDVTLADLGDEEVGTGSGLLNAVQQFGGALGVAVLGTVFFDWLPARGWTEATQALLAVSVGCYGVSFAVGFLLPRRSGEPCGAP